MPFIIQLAFGSPKRIRRTETRTSIQTQTHMHHDDTPGCTRSQRDTFPHTRTRAETHTETHAQTHYVHTPGWTRAVITTPCRARISSGVDSNAVMVNRSHTQTDTDTDTGTDTDTDTDIHTYTHLDGHVQ
jgi:hypothetical protein